MAHQDVHGFAECLAELAETLLGASGRAAQHIIKTWAPEAKTRAEETKVRRKTALPASAVSQEPPALQEHITTQEWPSTIERFSSGRIRLYRCLVAPRHLKLRIAAFYKLQLFSDLVGIT